MRRYHFLLSYLFQPALLFAFTLQLFPRRIDISNETLIAVALFWVMITMLSLALTLRFVFLLSGAHALLCASFPFVALLSGYALVRVSHSIQPGIATMLIYPAILFYLTYAMARSDGGSIASSAIAAVTNIVISVLSVCNAIMISLLGYSG